MLRLLHSFLDGDIHSLDPSASDNSDHMSINTAETNLRFRNPRQSQQAARFSSFWAGWESASSTPDTSNTLTHHHSDGNADNSNSITFPNLKISAKKIHPRPTAFDEKDEDPKGRKNLRWYYSVWKWSKIKSLMYQGVLTSLPVVKILILDVNDQSLTCMTCSSNQSQIVDSNAILKFQSNPSSGRGSSDESP
jgi:hypothetical protein